MGVLVRFRVLFLWKLIIFWDRGNRNAVIMREMAPGANGFFNINNYKLTQPNRIHLGIIRCLRSYNYGWVCPISIPPVPKNNQLPKKQDPKSTQNAHIFLSFLDWVCFFGCGTEQ